MVNCCILSCPSNAAHAEISFFRFPVIRADEESRRLSIDRRGAWIVAVNRKNINFDYALVCSRHFISGRPAKLNEYRHPDWVPSLELTGKDASGVENSSAASKGSSDVEESIQIVPVTTGNKYVTAAGIDPLRSIAKTDPAKICRLCLGKEVKLTRPFQKGSATDETLLHRIYECTTVKITLKANYPASICAICDTKLSEYSRFRQKCIENDAVLRTLLDSETASDKESNQEEDTPNVAETLEFQESAEIRDLQIQLYGSSDETTVSQSEFAASEEPPALKIASVTSKAPVEPVEDVPVTDKTVVPPSAADTATEVPETEPVPKKTRPTISVKPLSSLAESPASLSEENANNAGPSSQQEADKSDKPTLPAIVAADGRLECVICSRPFRNTYTLRRHMNLHTEQNLYTCEYCNKKFNDRSNWKIHLRAHTGDNLLRCAVCFKTFISPSTLKYHLRAHRKIKVFECRLCMHTTETYDALSAHVAEKHGNVRPEDLAKAADDAITAGDFLKIELEADESSMVAALESEGTEAMDSTPIPEPPPLIPAPAIAAAAAVAGAAPALIAVSATSKAPAISAAVKTSTIATPVKNAIGTSGAAPFDNIKIKEEIIDDDLVQVKQEPLDDDSLEPDPDGEKQMQEQLSALLPTNEEEAPPVILFRCDYCMKIFKYLYELRLHMKLHNGKQLPATSGEKSRAAPPARLVVAPEPPPAKKPRHPSIDADVGELVNAPLPEHACGKCDKVFRTEELLKVHRETHKTDKVVVEARSCKVCFKTFKCELNLVSHMRKHHPYETYVTEQQQQLQLLQQQQSSQNEQPTTTVDDKPPSPDSSSTDGGNTSQGESQESSTNADATATTGTGRKCEICALAFDCAYKLEKHVLTHFKNNEAVAFVPSAERPYKCTECHKRFKRKDYLLIHIRTHTGERRHKCDLCSSAFVHPSNLITHRKLHSNERPFKCDLCPADFKLYAGLKIHRKRCAVKYLHENSVTIS